MQHTIQRTIRSALFLTLAFLPAPIHASAQSVQPVIVEYGSKAEGRFTVTNNSPDVMAVVFEPRSFSIGLDGRGIFRPLDSGIQVELSTMSVRLQPQQSYIVFYKARAETTPAWFTIYSTFSPIRHGAQLSLRIQLPHTVYLYQEKPLQQADIHILSNTFSPLTHTLTCELENTSSALTRVHEVHAAGPHGGSASLAGFPLLPGARRRFTLEWTSEVPPESLTLHFEHFTLKSPTLAEPPASAQLTLSDPQSPSR